MKITKIDRIPKVGVEYSEKKDQIKKLTGRRSLIYFLSISIVCVLLLLRGAGGCYAQNVGINTTGSIPNTSAGLDIDFTNKGLLIPRIPLIQTTSNAPIGAGIAISLLVYNTATVNDVTPGYYYWDGTAWVKFNTGTGASNDWSLLGNAGTTAGTNFIGTTDNQNIVFKRNNAQSMRLMDLAGTPLLDIRNTTNQGRLGVGGSGSAVLNVGTMFGISGTAGTMRQYVDNTAANTTLNFDNAGGATILNVNFEDNIGIGTASARTGKLFFRNATNANVLTIQSGNTTASHTLTLPPTQGASNTILTNDGAGNLSWTLPAAGGGGFTDMQVFTASGSFTVPAGVTKIMVEVVGGGGGGGSGDSGGCGGGGCRGAGGNGGGYAKSILTVVPAAVHTVVVGAAGLGAASGPCGVGTNGGTSSFGTPTILSATGGQRGNGCSSNFGSTTPGNGVGGQLNISGQYGQDSYTTQRHYGGLSGHGSTIGQGGIGDTQFFGRDGAAGAVIITW